jgi:hypothetical protein
MAERIGGVIVPFPLAKRAGRLTQEQRVKLLDRLSALDESVSGGVLELLKREESGAGLEESRARLNESEVK